MSCSSDEEYFSGEETETLDRALRKPVATAGACRFYETSARDLTGVSIWSYQRCIDPSHVAALTKEFRAAPRAIGTVKALRDAEGSLRIVDGQHRLKAWREIMGGDAAWDVDVLLEVHPVDNFDSPESLELFKRVNNVKNLSPDDFPCAAAQRMVRRFRGRWPDMLKRPPEGARVNRPRVDSRILHRQLKEYMEGSRLSEARIWDQIEVANRMRGLWAASRFACSGRTLDKARAAGFYLGLDRDMTWLDQIH